MNGLLHENKLNKISIITVCLNSEKTIEKTIKSILKQNYPNKEIIIIDGKSTDRTLEILNKYSKDIKIIISEKDKSLYHAMNKGIKLSEGEIIVILNSDDIFFDCNVLKNISNYFLNNSGIEIILSDTYIINNLQDKKIIRKYKVKNFEYWHLRLGVSPPHPSCFIRKSVYLKHGLFDLEFKYASDFELLFRFIYKKKVKFLKYNIPTALMSLGGISSRNFKSIINSSKEINLAIKKNGYYSNLFFILLRLPYKFIQYFI